MLKTALYKQHMALSAQMLPFAGFDMPLQYSSIKEEVLSVRRNVGLFDVGHMGEFFVEGPEAVPFVDYLITNDLKNVKNGRAVYSPLCREDGTIIDDLIAYKLREDKVLICVNAANIDKDWIWFSHHLNKLNFDCQLFNRSNSYSLLALQGPKAVETLFSMKLLADFVGGSEGDEFPYYSVRQTLFQGKELIVARTGYTGEDGFEIFCSHSHQVLALWKNFLEEGITPCGLAARDVLRLEVCYPLYGQELKDTITPLDSGLKWTVKFHKKNFISKKALLNYKPRYCLVKLSINKGIPRGGYSIMNKNAVEIGQVTSGTMAISLDGKGIALGLVERDKISQAQDETFFIRIRKNIFQAQYHSRPFVLGGHK